MTTICVLGGGVHVATLVDQMADALLVPSADIRITARNQQRLATIGDHCRALLQPRRPTWTITTSTDRTSALDGADLIISLVRVGGLAAREHDERFPVQVDQVGDEGLGLGGAANTWRTIPFLQDLIHDIRRYAPHALVLNLMAPLPTTTRCLAEGGLRAVGVCELPLTTEARIDPHLQGMAYGGINHLGWFCPSTDAEWALVERAVAHGVADEQTVSRFSAVPLHYYYRLFDPIAAARLGHEFVPGRAQALQALADEAVDAMRTDESRAGSVRSRRSTPWFDHALIPILRALLDGQPHHGFINTVHETDPFPPGSLMESRAVWSSEAPIVEPLPDFPDAVAQFLVQIATADDLAFQAAMNRDEQQLRRSVEALPLKMNSDQVHFAVEQIIAGAKLGQ